MIRKAKILKESELEGSSIDYSLEASSNVESQSDTASGLIQQWSNIDLALNIQKLIFSPSILFKSSQKIIIGI